MIPRWVERYMQIPFVDLGRSPRGCDCLGLVRLVFAMETKIAFPDYGFVSSSDRKAIAKAIAAAKAADDLWSPVPIREAKPFDVVTMTSADSRGEADHLGVMVSGTRVLHTEEASGPVCEDISSYSIRYRLEPRGAPVVHRFKA